jgi:hypothetical protein
MASQYSYGYLKEAVKGHLDLEEDELEAMNINTRFHIFANEAIQQICHNKAKQLYFQFTAVSAFVPTTFDDGVQREATAAEIEANTITFATDEETTAYHNNLGIYLVGQVITMPDDFLSFLVKKAYVWTTTINTKQPATKAHIQYISYNELLVYYAATYQIPYRATWTVFSQDIEEDTIISMPADLLLTIPIYVASVFLQQRDLNMAQAKRQEFEIALSRCKSISFLESKDITPSFV